MMKDLITALHIPNALKEIPQFRIPAHALKRQEHNILTSFTCHQPSEPIEAIHGRLESLRRIALGFRNIRGYRLRCPIHSGALKDTLLHL